MSDAVATIRRGDPLDEVVANVVERQLFKGRRMANRELAVGVDLD